MINGRITKEIRNKIMNTSRPSTVGKIKIGELVERKRSDGSKYTMPISNDYFIAKSDNLTYVEMYNDFRKVCIACEGILCGEREDMYQFRCNFLAKSSPRCPLSEVNAVATDGFFDQALVVKLGFVNAHLFWISGISLILD